MLRPAADKSAETLSNNESSSLGPSSIIDRKAVKDCPPHISNDENDDGNLIECDKSDELLSDDSSALDELSAGYEEESEVVRNATIPQGRGISTN